MNPSWVCLALQTRYKRTRCVRVCRAGREGGWCSFLFTVRGELLRGRGQAGRVSPSAGSSSPPLSLQAAQHTPGADSLTQRTGPLACRLVALPHDAPRKNRQRALSRQVACPHDMVVRCPTSTMLGTMLMSTTCCLQHARRGEEHHPQVAAMIWEASSCFVILPVSAWRTACLCSRPATRVV